MTMDNDEKTITTDVGPVSVEEMDQKEARSVDDTTPFFNVKRKSASLPRVPSSSKAEEENPPVTHRAGYRILPSLKPRPARDKDRRSLRSAGSSGTLPSVSSYSHDQRGGQRDYRNQPCYQRDFRNCHVLRDFLGIIDYRDVREYRDSRDLFYGSDQRSAGSYTLYKSIQPTSPFGDQYHDVVMTASKRGIESVIRIERIAKNEVNYNDVYHVAGGPLKGIVINRAKKDLQNLGNAQIRMCFTVSLRNRKQHGGRTKEDRELLFWFKPTVDRISQQRYAREYFDMLISPEDFPRDYTNFIKKAIVLTKSFPDLRSLEVVMKPPVNVPVDETDKSFVETAEEKIIVTSPPPLEVAPTLNASFDEDAEREERIGRSKGGKSTDNVERERQIKVEGDYTNDIESGKAEQEEREMKGGPQLKMKMEEGSKKTEEAQRKKKEEEEAKRKEDERKRKEMEEAKRKEEEEAKSIEEERKRAEEEEARRKEEERRRKEEEENKAKEEHRKLEDDKAKIKEKEERKRKEDEAREEEERRKREEEEAKRNEEERKRKEEEEAKRREDEAKRTEEEREMKEEEERKRKEDSVKEEENRKRKEEEHAKRREESDPIAQVGEREGQKIEERKDKSTDEDASKKPRQAEEVMGEDYEFDESEDEDDEDRIENFITVLTPALYDYQYMPEVPVSNKTWISFRVRGKADAHIALSSVYGDTERKTYEVVIGGWNNTRSVVRDGGQGPIVTDAVTLNILSGYEFRSFWVSWDRGVVRVGEGTRRNHQPFLMWNVPENKQHGVNCIAVSSGPGSEGEWEFIEYIMPPKAEEQTKSARKAKIRMSLLWLAKKQKMLQVLEDCYPNSMGTAELLRLSNIKLHDMMTAIVFLRDLQNRGLITEVTKGIWMRAPGGKNDKSHVVKVVNEMPALQLRDSPTVAIISAMFCEKLAVDAMMDTKTSFINYKQGGESQVYTIGRIGNHQVVSTKLSRIGASRQSALNAGHSTQVMLATFKHVDHVFLVGCGGAVPNYVDYDRHVRLGDIVVTNTGSTKGAHEYLHCEKIEQTGQETYDYENCWWRCRNSNMKAALDQMRSLNNSDIKLTRPWERYVMQGMETLHAEESSFHRPAIKTDRLYAEIEGRMVQVEHPKPPLGQDLELDNKPRVRYGPIASGRYVARNQRMRMDYARKFGVITYTQEFDAVLAALDKCNKDSFLVIRGISDYVDGSKLKDWQPYASLVAAAFMKAIVTALPSSRRYGYY